MRCKRCGKAINPLRQLTDREFCCENHRKRGPRASASILRDLEYEEDPLWNSQQAQLQKQQNRASTAGLVLMVMGGLGVLVAARLWFPDTAAGTGRVAGATQRNSRDADEDNRRIPTSEPGGWTAWLEDHLPGQKPLRARTDFQSRMSDWLGSSTGWQVAGDVVRPGKLRLWKPTMQGRNYDLEFRASIEKKAVSWTFRSSDADNYYATKIVLNRPGVPSGASIIRYAVVKSQPFARMELPLPISLEKGKPYDVAVFVSGRKFVTAIDGRVVDEWSDSRLPTGGVGFFSEEGESSSLSWANYRERKGIMDRFLTAEILLPMPPVAFSAPVL